MAETKGVAASSAGRRDNGDGPVPAEQMPKLAERIAAQLEHEIIESRTPVGAVFGIEADLLVRYDVSRSVFREAVRLLEHHGVATMRRGPRGGLVVTEPDAEAVAHAMSVYMKHRGVSVSDVYEVRRMVETHAVQLAAERASENDVATMLELIDNEEELLREELFVHSHDFHITVARMTRNPAIELFVRSLTELTGEMARQQDGATERAVRASHDAHEKIAAAIIAGDPEQGRRRMELHINAMMNLPIQSDSRLERSR